MNKRIRNKKLKGKALFLVEGFKDKQIDLFVPYKYSIPIFNGEGIIINRIVAIPRDKDHLVKVDNIEGCIVNIYKSHNDKFGKKARPIERKNRQKENKLAEVFPNIKRGV